MVLASLGFTTLSRAFTLLLVTLIASSKVMNAVCREANLISSSVAFMKVLLAP